MKSTLVFQAALLGLLSAACSSPSTSTDAANSGSAPSGKPAATGHSGNPLCDKAAKLHDRLLAIDTKPTRITTDVKLPVSDEGQSPPDAPVLEIASKWLMSGRPVEGPADLMSQLQGRSAHVLIVAIGADASLKALPGLFSALGNDMQVWVVASPKSGKREPAPAAISKALSEPDQSQRATALSEVLKKSISSCAPAQKVFQSLGGSSHEAQIKALQTDLPLAIDSCSCKVDDNLVDTVAYLVGGDVPVVGKRVVFSRDPSAKKLSVADLDAQKLYDALPKDASPIVLTK